MPLAVASKVLIRGIACGSMFVVALTTRPLSAQTSPRADDTQALLQRMDCSLPARQHNPTLTVAECERKKASVGQLDAVMRTPGGERPGDENLSCAQVIAEMQSLHFAGISEDTAHESAAAGQQLREALESGTAAAGAMAARHTMETMAVVAMPNAVQGVVAYRHAAEQVALGKANTARMADARGRAGDIASQANMELAANLQANPRFARLMQLVQQKNCQFNDAPAPPAREPGAE